MKSLHKIVKALAAAALMAVAAGAATSCDSVIYDDLDPCPQGVELRFVYDYNMEFANAFPSKVSCLNVEIYDNSGRYLTTQTVAGPELADEDWRMTLDLDPGHYTFVAYGGMACNDASFAFVNPPAPGSLLTSLAVELKPGMAGTELHHLFYGRLDVDIDAADTERRRATVRMMKDTNNIRILLQNVDGHPVDNTDFTFSLTADNTLMAWDNSLVATSETLYTPWTQGQATAQGQASLIEPNILAYAEFSSGRFVVGYPLSLTITRRRDNRTVLSIPLLRYLLLLKSQEFASMGSQEFLDRESSWRMILFLDSEDNWINTSIVVNDWVIRINDASL